jgi:hypothetical protein
MIQMRIWKVARRKEGSKKGESINTKCERRRNEKERERRKARK